MAGAPAPTLDELGLRALWDSVPPSGQLPALFLVLPAKEDGTGLRVTAFLVRIRSGGFMVVLPDFVEVTQFLREQCTSDGSEACAIYPTEVLMETPRGRVLADGPCILVDLVWEMVALFMRAHPLRSSSTFELLRFALNDQPCRPRRSAVAEQWIHEVMDDDTAGDYVTGLSEEELLVEEDPAGAGGDGSVHLDALQRRVSELEAVLRQQSPAAATPLARRPATSVTPSRGVLFDGARAIPNTEPREEALARLRSLAGAAPMRFCAHEQAQRAQRPEQVLESLQQEEGLEALETGELEEGTRDLEATVQDPVQRMLLLQTQQLSLLTRQQQQQQKQQDPISVRWWGRVFKHGQCNRLPNTLSPFSRLANASWVGANVAFMKDSDFLESKMKATSGTTKGVGAQEDEREEPAPKKKKANAGATTEGSTA